MVFNLFDSKEQMEQEIDFNSLTIMAHKGKTKENNQKDDFKLGRAKKRN